MIVKKSLLWQIQTGTGFSEKSETDQPTNELALLELSIIGCGL